MLMYKKQTMEDVVYIEGFFLSTSFFGWLLLPQIPKHKTKQMNLRSIYRVVYLLACGTEHAHCSAHTHTHKRSKMYTQKPRSPRAY